MASANEILTDACESGIASLPSGLLLAVAAQSLLTTAGVTVEDALSSACESGAANLGKKDLLAVAAQSLNT